MVAFTPTDTLLWDRTGNAGTERAEQAMPMESSSIHMNAGKHVHAAWS